MCLSRVLGCIDGASHLTRIHVRCLTSNVLAATLTADTKASCSHGLLLATGANAETANADFLAKMDGVVNHNNKLIKGQTDFLTTKVLSLRNDINRDFQAPLTSFVRTADQIYSKSDTLSDKIDAGVKKLDGSIFELIIELLMKATFKRSNGLKSSPTNTNT